LFVSQLIILANIQRGIKISSSAANWWLSLFSVNVTPEQTQLPLRFEFVKPVGSVAIEFQTSDLTFSCALAAISSVIPGKSKLASILQIFLGIHLNWPCYDIF
jgi:hypothetical protein